MKTRLALLSSLAVLASLALAPAAVAAKAPCLPGSKVKCLVWDAKVGPVDDGDTINVRINGSKKLERLRLNGVQAMEMHSYSRKQGRSGECTAVEATERLEGLIRRARSKVRVLAQKKNSKTGGDRVRYRRAVQVKQGGKWVDLGSVLIREGLALWLPNGDEWAFNGPYSRLAEQAQRSGKNLWNPQNCGAGPHQSSALGLKVKWDAEDDDSKNLNGEWIRITNSDPVNAVSLRGWWLRDSFFRGNHAHGYEFPAGAVVPPLGSIRVRVGRGANSATELFWGLGETVFENATDDKKEIGDGAYLFDPDGDIRAYQQYPCRTNCPEPLAGKVKVEARYMGLEHEWVTITNTSSAPISLAGYDLESVPWFYEFDARDVLAPGKSVVVWIDEPHEIPVGAPGVRRVFVFPVPGVGEFASASFFRSWNHREALLGDGKDVVTLRNPQGAPVTCDAWGGERCPSV